MRCRAPKLTIVVLLVLFAVTAGASPSVEPITADGLYDGALKIWAGGDQRGADSVLEEAQKTFPMDIRFTFFLATSIRSRFEIEDAAPLFQAVARSTPNDPHGMAAALILLLDQKRDVEKNFKALDDLSAANPKDPLLLWMVAVQCRALNKNEIGAQRYAQLLKMVNPGPVLVHQTYANILDELNRSADALPQRLIAVKQEPAPWSYDGLGNTLSRLGRWHESDAAHQQATSMQPEMARYWENWSISKRDRGNILAVAEMDAKVAEAEAAQLTQAPPPKPFSSDWALGTAYKSMKADELYAYRLRLWKDGDEQKTKDALLHGMDFFADDERFKFLAGACLLSENDLTRAADCFGGAYGGNPKTVIAHAAEWAIRLYRSALDGPADSVQTNFKSLNGQLAKDPQNPVLIYVVAYFAARNQHEDIARDLYGKLMPMLNPGTAGVHLDYANLLETANQEDQALAQLQIAIKLEPTAENYDRLAMVLANMQKWDEVDAAFEKCTTLKPDDPTFFNHWADTKEVRGDQAGAKILSDKAKELIKKRDAER